MNCKKCQTELEEGVTLCPSCGTENAGLSAGKIALLVALSVAAIAVIAALILGGGNGTAPEQPAEPTGTVGESTPGESLPAPTAPADGNADDVTCKGSYTVTDEELTAALSAVVATVGDQTLTNEELQIYYWMTVIDFLNEYYAYASMFGLDITQPLDTQISLEGTTTWQQYFLSDALNRWYYYKALSLEADASGFTLDQDTEAYLQGLPASLEANAASLGFENALAMIQGDLGSGATMEGYLAYMRSYYLGYNFYGTTLESMEFDDAEIEAYFDEHASEYAENGLTKNEECYVDVRHILISPTSATGSDTYTEEEWAAAEAKANQVLGDWLNGQNDEAGFAALAQDYSQDPGSAANGGLYEGVYAGQMVEPFDTWCFDASRRYGDYGIVKTNYGYHIMYFVRSTPVWYLVAREDMLAEAGDSFLNEVLQKYPAEFDYSAMALGFVNLGAAG